MVESVNFASEPCALHPVLFSEKFPQLRPADKLMANITPAMQERIKKQDAAWRLVFDGE